MKPWLRQLGLWSLEERRNRADLIELFRLMKGLSSTPWSHFFKKADTSVRGHTWKLVKKHCHCYSRLYFFSQRVINRWNKLSQEDVDTQSINCFKNRLEKRRTRQMDFFKDLYSLLVLSAARKDKQELVHQDGTSMPGAAAPGKYPVNNIFYVKSIYSYFSIGNGQPREPAQCQLYRHTFVPYPRIWNELMQSIKY